MSTLPDGYTYEKWITPRREEIIFFAYVEPPPVKLKRALSNKYRRKLRMWRRAYGPPPVSAYDYLCQFDGRKLLEVLVGEEST